MRLAQEVVQCLGVGLHRLRDARQGLALGLSQQADMQQRELFELAHIGKQIPILRAIVVDERHCRRWRRVRVMALPLLCGLRHAVYPTMTEEG